MDYFQPQNQIINYQKITISVQIVVHIYIKFCKRLVYTSIKMSGSELRSQEEAAFAHLQACTTTTVSHLHRRPVQIFKYCRSVAITAIT